MHKKNIKKLKWEPVYYAMPITEKNKNLHGFSVNVIGDEENKLFLMKNCCRLINYNAEISDKLLDELIIEWDINDNLNLLDSNGQPRCIKNINIVNNKLIKIFDYTNDVNENENICTTNICSYVYNTLGISCQC